MSRRSRQETEVRRLIELGRPVSAVRRNKDKSDRPYHIAATLRKVGIKYHLLVDVYYPTGTTGDTIEEQGKTFSGLDDAIHYLEDEIDIELREFKA